MTNILKSNQSVAECLSWRMSCLYVHFFSWPSTAQIRTELHLEDAKSARSCSFMERKSKQLRRSVKLFVFVVLIVRTEAMEAAESPGSIGEKRNRFQKMDWE